MKIQCFKHSINIDNKLGNMFGILLGVGEYSPSRHCEDVDENYANPP